MAYLWRKLEHGRAHDERGGVVFGGQCQSVSSCHSPQRAVCQDSLRTNDHLWKERRHELRWSGVPTGPLAACSGLYLSIWRAHRPKRERSLLGSSRDCQVLVLPNMAWDGKLQHLQFFPHLSWKSNWSNSQETKSLSFPTHSGHTLSISGNLQRSPHSQHS